jgi:hypothetical protein
MSPVSTPRCSSCGRFYPVEGACHARAPYSLRAAVLIYTVALSVFVVPFLIVLGAR